VHKSAQDSNLGKLSLRPCVAVDRVQRRPHPLRRLLGVQQVGVHGLEERRVQLQRLRDDFPVGQQAGADHLDLRQRRGGGEDPQRGVFEVAARDEELVSLVNRRQRVRRRAEELHLPVALAQRAQPGAEVGDRPVVGVEQPALGQERVHERVADRALDHFAELRARQEERVHVDPVRVERQVRPVYLPVVDRDEHQVDVGLRPHGVVGQAAAEDGREDGAVGFHLLDQGIERCGGLSLDGAVVHERPSEDTPETLPEATAAATAGVRVGILAEPGRGDGGGG
jgi:hypothetical protein